jgi:hypothetical protein
MTHMELAAKLDSAEGEKEMPKAFWPKVLPRLPLPSDEQFMFWVSVYGFNHAHYAVRETGLKNARMGFAMTAEHSLRFVSRVMADKAERRAA